MPNDFDLAIVGGGLASARAIKSYREAGGGGSVALFSADTFVPYHRPPLSKRYLRGEQEWDAALVEPESFYAENDVKLFLETVVTSVDTETRTIETERGDRRGFERLLIASGAVPRSLDVPGATLGGVFVLRSLAESTRIRAAAVGADRAVVVGAGFIGTEVAASLVQLGLDVTLVHRGQGLFDQLGVPELARELADLYREQGVELVLEDEAVAFHGASTLESVETKGGRTLEAQMAVVGVGVAPATGFLEGSGLELDNGVVVDQRFRTNVEGVYAAGDVARFFDPLFGTHRRIEHWSNANYQGTEVGKVLAGGGGGYDIVSSFFSEVFGVTIKVFGDTTASDRVETTGSLADGLVARFSSGDRLVGALVVGQDEETENALKVEIAG